MFHFTALLGAQSDSPAIQSLLELDNGIKILINVGWDSTFSAALLSELERHTPTIDLILLTHPTLEHMGAYAHACKHIPTFGAIPVYSTFPVSNLGRLLLQDMYLSTPAAFTRVRDRPAKDEYSTKVELPMDALMLPPTPAEIDGYCSKIVTLKYSQPTPLHTAVSRVAGKLGSVTITAYSAGHSLGGTLWKIQQGQESIVYAVDWNLSRENCLRGAEFLGGEGGRVQEALAKPTALVCSARNASITNLGGGRKKRDEMLLDTIRRVALENSGTVLIPTDSVGRVLELAYLLEHAWRNDDKLGGKNSKGVGLFLAGRKVKRLSQVVGSMLEWMDGAVVREFEAIAEASARQGDKKGRRDNRRGDADQDDGKSADTGNKAGPFDFLHLNLVSSPAQLNKILSNNDGRGKVIIASDSSLEWGLGRDALLKIANNDNNMVILTDRSDGKPTLSGHIYDGWRSATGSEVPGTRGSLSTTAPLTAYNKLPLAGDELLSYQHHLTTSTTAQQTLLTTSPAILDDADASSSDSDSDSDSEQQGKSLLLTRKPPAPILPGLPAPPPADIGANVLLKAPGVYDFTVLGQKGRNRMFPFQIRRKRVDEYGEVVRPDDYLRAEERTDADAPPSPVAPSRIIGKKRKWDLTNPLPSKPLATAAANSSNSKRTKRSSSTTPSSAEEGEVSDSDTESEDTLLAPTKLITHTANTLLRIAVTFIDFSGLHDEKALRMLLPLINPKKLILTAATPTEASHLAAFYRSKLKTQHNTRSDTTADVFAPRNGERIDASVDTNAWAVQLTPALTRSLKWQHVRGLGVVHVLGRVLPAATDNDTPEPEAKKQRLLEAPPLTAQVGQLLLDVLPPQLAASTRAVAQPIHVGDIRLADLRRVLLEGGHVAEFKGEGTLLVDGCVVVRKRGVGRVDVEDGGGVGVRKGGRGEQGEGSFAEVRRKVYDGLAVVAGG